MYIILIYNLKSVEYIDLHIKQLKATHMLNKTELTWVTDCSYLYSIRYRKLQIITILQ